MNNFFAFRQWWILTPFLQIIIMVVLLVSTMVYQYFQYLRTDKMFGHYPASFRLFLAPFYEEVLFRGFILFGLLLICSPILSIAISSLLFGLVHLRNFKYMSLSRLIKQVLYTGLIFGPIAGYITYQTGTIWLAVILHFLNNFVASPSQRLLHQDEALVTMNPDWF